jgi:hypothetical protein
MCCMKRTLIVALAAAAALALPPAVAAKDGLVFPRASAHVGDRIVLSTPWASHRRGVIVYFMPLALSPKFWPTYQAVAPAWGPAPRLRGAIRLGMLRPWGANGTRLVFHVPKVAPGRYVLGFWCLPCGAHWTSALPNYQPTPRGILRVLR